MWAVKATVVPIVIWGTKLGWWIQQIPGTTSEIPDLEEHDTGTRKKILDRLFRLSGLQ